jgi:hypothetical protein
VLGRPTPRSSSALSINEASVKRVGGGWVSCRSIGGWAAARHLLRPSPHQGQHPPLSGSSVCLLSLRAWCWRRPANRGRPPPRAGNGRAAATWVDDVGVCRSYTASAAWQARKPGADQFVESPRVPLPSAPVLWYGPARRDRMHSWAPCAPRLLSRIAARVLWAPVTPASSFGDDRLRAAVRASAEIATLSVRI